MPLKFLGVRLLSEEPNMPGRVTFRDDPLKGSTGNSNELGSLSILQLMAIAEMKQKTIVKLQKQVEMQDRILQDLSVDLFLRVLLGVEREAK